MLGCCTKPARDCTWSAIPLMTLLARLRAGSAGPDGGGLIGLDSRPDCDDRGLVRGRWLWPWLRWSDRIGSTTIWLRSGEPHRPRSSPGCMPGPIPPTRSFRPLRPRSRSHCPGVVFPSLAPPEVRYITSQLVYDLSDITLAPTRWRLSVCGRSSPTPDLARSASRASSRWWQTMKDWRRWHRATPTRVVPDSSIKTSSAAVNEVAAPAGLGADRPARHDAGLVRRLISLRTFPAIGRGARSWRSRWPSRCARWTRWHVDCQFRLTVSLKRCKRFAPIGAAISDTTARNDPTSTGLCSSGSGATESPIGAS